MVGPSVLLCQAVYALTNPAKLIPALVSPPGSLESLQWHLLLPSADTILQLCGGNNFDGISLSRPLSVSLTPHEGTLIQSKSLLFRTQR